MLMKSDQSFPSVKINDEQIDWPNDSVTNASIDFHIPDCTEDVLKCICLM